MSLGLLVYFIMPAIFLFIISRKIILSRYNKTSVYRAP
jgi:hypothetical protein